MAGQLSLAAAKVIGPDGEVVSPRAQVLVRGNVLTMRYEGRTETLDGVQSVRQPRRGEFVVRFPDATEYVVTRIGRKCGSCRA
jgi:hypothetical protein